jgi:hypothetical protein
MDDTEEETEAPPVECPAVGWTYKAFIDATSEAIAEKTVECKTCPVFMMCESETGGTGWVCPKCRTTGVFIDEPADLASMPDYVLVIDCHKHKFEVKKESSQITECSLCSGGLMELEVLNQGTKNFYVRTVHASVTTKERQEKLKKAWAYWTKYYEDKKAEETKEP